MKFEEKLKISVWWKFAYNNQENDSKICLFFWRFKKLKFWLIMRKKIFPKCKSFYIIIDNSMKSLIEFPKIQDKLKNPVTFWKFHKIF